MLYLWNCGIVRLMPGVLLRSICKFYAAFSSCDSKDEYADSPPPPCAVAYTCIAHSKSTQPYTIKSPPVLLSFTRKAYLSIAIEDTVTAIAFSSSTLSQGAKVFQTTMLTIHAVFSHNATGSTPVVIASFFPLLAT